MITGTRREGLGASGGVAEDGRILFALQEERVNRIKEYHGFPHQAVDIALSTLGLDPGEVELVSFANQASPLLTKEQFLAVYEQRASRDWELGWAGAKRRLKTVLNRVAPGAVQSARRQRWVRSNNAAVQACLHRHGLAGATVVRHHHQLNHAAAAYFGCRADPESQHLVLALDGGGDDACAHVYVAEAGRLELIAATPLGHSVGNIYAAATQVMGMRPHEHEYKLMGLAAYSDAAYSEAVRERFASYLDLDSDNPLDFRRCTPEPTFEIQRRLVHDMERCRFDNLAGGLQAFTEDLLCRWVAAAVARTGIGRVVAAGGVFMNVKANQRIAAMPEVSYFDVFPSCGDESLPFGAAWLEAAAHAPEHQAELGLEHYYLGPDGGWDLAAVREARYEDAGLVFEELDEPNQRVAELLAAGQVVARCSGPMEFGARALGNRSILADPADSQVVPRINKMIKMRDFWMPFAPAIMREHAEDYLEIPSTLPAERISPYMMHTFATRENRRELVAGVHQHDLTARAQIVSRDSNADFHDLIDRFRKLTGRAVVLNTSFNLHGYPIVMGTADAVQVLEGSGLDCLVVNNTLIRKVAADDE